MMNKKGEEGPGMGTFIGVLVILIAAIIVIMFFTGAFGRIGESFGAAFSSGTSVEAVIQSCGTIAVQAESKYLYCEDFKKVSFPTGAEWINCEDSRVVDKFTQHLSCKGTEVQAFCMATVNAEALKAGTPGTASAAKYTAQFVKSCNSVKVNGQTCTQWGISGCAVAA